MVDAIITEEMKKQIFELMSTPGIEMVDIANRVGIEYEKLLEFLSDEYFKYNLDYGRRMCCR